MGDAGKLLVLALAELEPTPSVNQTGTKLPDRSMTVPVPTVIEFKMVVY